jgi:adenine-specific DNA glycosylase
VKLPGVGRKTANVVLGVAFQSPEGVVVDTHVQRISQRLGWTKATMPEGIEQDLMKLFPRSDWDMLSHTLIFHGRRICFARKPACPSCPVNDVCPSAFRAELVGRKPSRLTLTPPPIALPRSSARPAVTTRTAAPKTAVSTRGAAPSPSGVKPSTTLSGRRAAAPLDKSERKSPRLRRP